ncbi:MAG TPA: hypothetical protein VE956_17820 [Nodularia sp. (in: cyanobacteria)]|nr:hypothetical protein [Nodularia sp. (in: cyanobacteria)]
MSNRQWLQISEYVLLSLSILGAIAVAVTQQVIYVAVPLILSLALNLANRPKLNSFQSQQQISQLQITLQNLQETMDTSNQRLQQIEAWRQQLTQVIDQKIEMSIPKLSTVFDEVNQKNQTVNNRLNQLDDSITNLSNTIHNQEEIFLKSQHNQTDISQFEQQFHSLNLRVEQIDKFVKSCSESNQQQLVEFSQIKQDQDREFSQVNQQIQVFQSRLEEIDQSIKHLHQTLGEQFQELEKMKQNKAAESSQFNQVFDSINERLATLDKLTDFKWFNRF